MSSGRIRHESRTCSELSYRIVMWNASRVQNTPVNLIRVEETWRLEAGPSPSSSSKRRINTKKDVEATLAIARKLHHRFELSHRPTCSGNNLTEKRLAGSWLSRSPFTNLE